MRDRKVILIPASGTSGRGDRRGQIERPHRLGSAARPRCTEPTPRRRRLAIRVWGEVRAGPRWVGVAGGRSCCHSGFQAEQLGRRSPREPGCARPRGRIPTSLRSRAPARERASDLRAPPLTLLSPRTPLLTPSLQSSPFHSHAPRPTRGSCILDSTGCDAEEHRASARPSLPPGSRAKTAQNLLLTFVCTAQW